MYHQRSPIESSFVVGTESNRLVSIIKLQKLDSWFVILRSNGRLFYYHPITKRHFEWTWNLSHYTKKYSILVKSNLYSLSLIGIELSIINFCKNLSSKVLLYMLWFFVSENFFRFILKRKFCHKC